jgi:hypothetical protein
MSVYMIDVVNNQLYREPDAGRSHIRILRGACLFDRMVLKYEKVASLSFVDITLTHDSDKVIL